VSSLAKTAPAEILRARQWWVGLEEQWKQAMNEATLGRGATLEVPSDEDLLLLRYQLDNLRFAGPDAQSSNLSIRLTNLSGVAALDHISFLSVTNCAIEGVEELVGHEALKHLYLYENALTSLEGIEGLTGMEELFVQHNKLTDLTPLRKLTNLKTLYASRNELASLEGLHEGHSDQLKRCFLLPNENLSQREIIRLQNEAFILVKTG